MWTASPWPSVVAAVGKFRAMQPVLQSAVTKGAIHRNTVARKLSRLSARIKAL